MKKAKVLFFIVLCALMVMLPANKAEASTKTIKAGSSYKFNGKNYYKIAVKSEGYITLKMSYGKSGGWSVLKLYDSKKNCINTDLHTSTSCKSNKTIKIAISKGVYYIKQSSGYGASKICYKYTKRKQKLNCSIGSALDLRENKKAEIYRSTDYNFERYYKIELTKDQEIEVTLEGTFLGVYVLDSDKNYISTKDTYSDYMNHRYTMKTQKLFAGTYYIQVDDATYGYGTIFSIKWKGID